MTQIELVEEQAPPGYTKSYVIDNFPEKTILRVTNNGEEIFSLQILPQMKKDSSRKVISLILPTQRKFHTRSYKFDGHELVEVSSWLDAQKAGVKPLYIDLYE